MVWAWCLLFVLTFAEAAADDVSAELFASWSLVYHKYESNKRCWQEVDGRLAVRPCTGTLDQLFRDYRKDRLRTYSGKCLTFSPNDASFGRCSHRLNQQMFVTKLTENNVTFFHIQPKHNQTYFLRWSKRRQRAIFSTWHSYESDAWLSYYQEAKESKFSAANEAVDISTKSAAELFMQDWTSVYHSKSMQRCWDAVGDKLQQNQCTGQPNQLFKEKAGQILNKDGSCLQFLPNDAVLRECDQNSPEQKFTISLSLYKGEQFYLVQPEQKPLYFLRYSARRGRAIFDKYHRYGSAAWGSVLTDGRRAGNHILPYPVANVPLTFEPIMAQHRLCSLQPPFPQCGFTETSIYGDVEGNGLDLRVSDTAQRLSNSFTVVQSFIKGKDNDLLLDYPSKNFQCSGLFAAANDIVNITIPDNYTGDIDVVLGMNRDDNSKVLIFKRPPIVTLNIRLRPGIPVQSVRTPYGGLICFRPMANTGNTFTFIISGAVEAPVYKHGITKVTEWSKIRLLPAPQTIISTKQNIWVLQSRHVRSYDGDITALPRQLDLMTGLHWQLAGFDKTADVPNRWKPAYAKYHWTHDVQIKIGHMHAHDPIAMQSNEKNALNLTSYPLGWGHAHELGHNLVNMITTKVFGTEVANNIFTLHYMLKTSPPAEVFKLKEELKENAENVVSRMKSGGMLDYSKYYVSSIPSAKSHLLVLQMQLTHFYGWEIHTKVQRGFREELGYEEARRIAGGQQLARDAVCIAYSKAANHSLVEFFTKWGLPPSHEAKGNIQLDRPEEDIWAFTAFTQ